MAWIDKKGLRYGYSKLDKTLCQMNKLSDEVKSYKEKHGKLESGIDSKRKFS